MPSNRIERAASGGRVALVTGAGGEGIGTCSATLLARKGWRVILNGRQTGRLQSLSEELRKEGLDAEFRVADVADPSAVDDMIGSIAATHGTIDALVCNAAPAVEYRGVREVTNEQWDFEVRTILNGAFYCSRAAAPLMQASGSGRIVFVSSSAARRGARGRSAAYAAAKAGLHGLARQLAIELGPDGITVNVVAPSQVDTPRVRRGGRRTDAYMRELGKRLPLGRVGLPTDVAEMIAYLASDAASYITGQVITIDGGGSLSPPTITLAK